MFINSGRDTVQDFFLTNDVRTEGMGVINAEILMEVARIQSGKFADTSRRGGVSAIPKFCRLHL